MTPKRLKAAILALLGILLLTASAGTPATADDERWFYSATTGHIDLADFERDRHCIWGTIQDTNALQRSGFCGLPKQANDRIVLTHNWKCDGSYCPTGLGKESNIPLLQPGDQIELYDYGYLHRGVVLEKILVRDGKIKPQDNFPCSAPLCGAIVTSVGDRRGLWGPADYVVVRFDLH